MAPMQGAFGAASCQTLPKFNAPAPIPRAAPAVPAYIPNSGAGTIGAAGSALQGAAILFNTLGNLPGLASPPAAEPAPDETQPAQAPPEEPPPSSRPRTASSSLMPPLPPCRAREAKTNIDWVLKDRGAKATFERNLEQGLSPLDAALAEQGHNRRAQNSIRACAVWAANYLAGLGAAPVGEPLGDRPLTSADCKCISVLPVGSSSKYQVTNTCDMISVSVLFGGDIAPISASNNAMSTWAQAGNLKAGVEAQVGAPDSWSIISINAISLKNASSSLTCPMN